MHVQQPNRSGAFMQVVDILRAQKKAVADSFLERAERLMRGVRGSGTRIAAALRNRNAKPVQDSPPTPRG